MNLTIPNSKADQLLEEIYSILKNPKELEKTDREKLEERLKEVISLRWEDSNLFESYFSELNQVLEAMARLDFTKRMVETDDSNSLLNLISVSFNRINDRLEEKYVGMDFIPELMESVRVKNRIIVVSSDKEVVSRAFANLESQEVNVKGLIDQPLNWVVKEEVLNLLRGGNYSYFEYDGELSPSLFPNLKNRKAHFSVKNGKEYLVATITAYPDNVIEENKDRILTLLRDIDRHFDKYPETVKSVSGYANAFELRMLVAELMPYIYDKFPPQDKPVD